MSAIDVLEKLIQRVLMVDRWKARPGNLGKPGEAVASLSKGDRKELQNLASKDVDGMRIDDESSLIRAAYWCDNYYSDLEQTKMLKEAKLAFDATKLKK